MLDRLRKHAGSWLIKVVLTLIILTFIFFFGYQQMTSQTLDTQRSVAQVGDISIPRRKYENMVAATMDRMRENLKGEVPEQMTGFLRQNVLDQLVTREAVVQFADDLGLTVSDEELANAIRSNKNLFPDGEFNQEAYQSRFLPRYRQEYGEDFETAMRRDLLVEKVQVFVTTLFAPWQTELEASLEENRKLRKPAPKPAKTAKAETQETQPRQVESLSPFDLFTTWLNAFKETLKIQVFERAS